MRDCTVLGAGLFAALLLAAGGTLLGLGTSGAAAQGVSAGRAGGAPVDGARVFASTCAACHGTGASAGRGPNLFDARLLASLGDTGLHDKIVNGVPGTEMPAFKSLLSEAQIGAVIAHLRAGAAAAAPSAVAQAGAGATAPPPDPDGQRIHSEKQDFRLDAVATGLDTPWALAFLPDGRMLVTERSGNLRVIDKAGRLLPDPVQGVPRAHIGQDAGLFDVAVNPADGQGGWVYLAYAESDPNAPEPPAPEPGAPAYLIKRKPSMTVVVRGKVDANNRWVEQQDVFRVPWSLYTPSGMHYGIRLLFDGKGHLFFSIGERGDLKNARDLGTPLGKIHRVNADGSIPTDNPFVQRPGAVASIWSSGHRNPQGLAIDPATGLLWESEHGPVGGDEINIIEKGKDYGWGSATKGVQPGIDALSAPGTIDPVAWYFPTIAPSGMTFYTGNRYPGWKGSLFVGALRGQQLRRLTVKGRQVVSQEVVFEQLGRVRDIATGPDGLLYALVQEPTGPGTRFSLSDPTPGRVVRLTPIVWQSEPMRRAP